ncbi:hypothetical protein KR018_008364, partial [Drosophila ironensis]
ATMEPYPDLATLCRLCLKEHNDAYGIFTASASVSSDTENESVEECHLSIPVRLMACIALDVKVADALPKKICGDCRYQLEKAFLFRQRCQASDKKLRKHIRLLGLGKRSRVFCRDPEADDYDEDELEFEDSIAFIARQDKQREAEEQKVREELEKKRDQEVHRQLEEARQEAARKVRLAVREELKEEVRREQVAKLMGELELFLAHKKDDSRPKSQPKATTAESPKQRTRSQAKMQPKVEIREEFVLCDSQETLPADDMELDSLDIEDGSAAEGQEYRDIKMVGAGEVGDIYIINSNADAKADTTPNFEPDDGVTSYNIKVDGEIQYSGEKSADVEDVVVFNLDSEMAADQQVYNFDENVIIVAKDKASEEPETLKRKRTSELVFKQSPREEQPKAGRVTDTVKTFHCQLCPISFATEKMLIRHLNTHTKGLKNGKADSMKCPICALQLSCASSLKRHMIVHTGLKPFKCGECEQSFAQREVLKRHMDTHTGAKRHQCPHCSSCFAQKSNLQQHIGRVHMETARTHKCHLCQRSFNHMSGLSRHLVTHAGVMFSCKQCGRQFNDRSAVQRHVQTVHKVSIKAEEDGAASEPEASE